MKWKLLWLVPLAVAAGIQLIAKRPQNPLSDPRHHVSAHVQMTPVVRGLLARSCADCHSHETRWPWYAQIAPVSWLVTRDVEQARRALNLSDWQQQTKGKRTIAASHLMAVCADVQQERMPPAAYLRMHPEADLTTSERSQLCQWTQTEAVRLRREERAVSTRMVAAR